MNYGLYLSASGALTSLHRMDVLANNLANANTPGFQPDAVYARHRLPERLESPTIDVEPQRLLEQLGGGVHVRDTAVQVQQGQLRPTGNPLDVAITGDGFLVVSENEGRELRLTRDGRMTVDAGGRLALVTTGQPVLNDANQPVRVSGNAPVRIDRDGNVFDGESLVGRLRLVNAPGDDLAKSGHNLLRLKSGDVRQLPSATAMFQQGYIEDSAVDPIMTLNQLIMTSKAVAANSLMMQYHDNALGQTINTFGRVT